MCVKEITQVLFRMLLGVTEGDIVFAQLINC